MSEEKDRIFFRNYSIILGVLAVMIVVFIILARIFGIDDEANAAQNADSVAKNTAPVGEVRVAGEVEPEQEPVQVAATEPASVDHGKTVYSGICFACHGTGLPGIPQLGDAAGWTDRISQGTDVLYDHALNGYTGSSGMPMPAKGGNPALSDEDVKAAVDYMVANSQ